MKKMMHFSDGFSIDFWSNFERFWEPFGLPNRCQNQWKNVSKNSLIFGRLFHEKWSQNGGPGDPKWRPKWRNFVDISQLPPRSPPGEGSGWIWGGFWEGFGGIWKPWGAQMDMKINTFRRKFRPFPQDPPRKALGRVLRGFGVFWGRYWEVLERFFADFSISFVRVSCGILGNPREGGWGNLRKT